MAEVRCNECGNTIRVQGLAATCPHCGNLVFANQAPRATPVTPPFSETKTPALKDQNPDEPIDLAFLADKLDDKPEYRVPLSHADSFPDPKPLEALVRTVRPAEPAERAPSRWEQLNLSTWQIALAATVLFVLFALMIDWMRLHFSHSGSQPVLVAETVESKPPQVVQAPPPVVETPSPQPPPPEVPTTLPPPPPPAPVYPHEALGTILPTPPKEERASELTDQKIGKSIRKGVDFLLDQFSGSRLRGGDTVDAEIFAGRNALCAYALLHAGKALDDGRITPQSEPMRGILSRMEEFPMKGNYATYSRSLRLGALSVFPRKDDLGAIDADASYLLKSASHGHFTYKMPDENVRLSANVPWDNSNSQYGALGLWFAADAGWKVPNVFWSEVEQHWIDTQSVTGGWDYTNGSGASLAMTAAGVTSLLVARDQLIANASNLSPNPDAPKALRRGLEWLDEGDNVLNFEGGGHPGYTLYGLERAGLASGYRFLGRHDWYLELAQKRLAQQKPEGSWDGGDGMQVETAFSLLFLSRGRHPIFMSKLRFEGNWQNNPRDMEYLTRYASDQLEKQLNWQIVDIDRPWQDWSDSGLLYLSTDAPFEVSDVQVAKLRSYINAGGLLFTEADNGSPAVNQFVADLAKKLFPDFAFAELPQNSPVYSANAPQKMPPKLFGVSNGVRVLMIHSPTDLSKAWQKRNDKLNPEAFQTGLNIAVYSTGKREFRNRLESLFISDPTESPVAVVPVARVKYNGNWDAEPGAWAHEAKAIESETRLRVDVKPVEARELTIAAAPLATLCVVNTLSLETAEIDALRQFVNKGGVLLVDAMGGSKAGVSAINNNLIAKLVPGASAALLPPTSPIIAGGVGYVKAELKLRPFSITALNSNITPPLRMLRIGNGQVIISDVDLTSGLLGTATWGIVGYQPTSSHELAKNIVVWSMRTPPR